jgi:hypothetical protein
MPVEKNFCLEGIQETGLRDNLFLLAALRDVKVETRARRIVPKTTFFPWEKIATCFGLMRKLINYQLSTSTDCQEFAQ